MHPVTTVTTPTLPPPYPTPHPTLPPPYPTPHPTLPPTLPYPPPYPHPTPTLTLPPPYPNPTPTLPTISQYVCITDFGKPLYHTCFNGQLIVLGGSGQWPSISAKGAKHEPNLLERVTTLPVYTCSGISRVGLRGVSKTRKCEDRCQ